MTEQEQREQHTPGPWRASCGADGVWTVDNWSPRDGNHEGLLVITAGPSTNRYSEANARLISAAPDLLEAASIGHGPEAFTNGGEDLIAAANALRESGHPHLADQMERKHEAELKAIRKAKGTSQ